MPGYRDRPGVNFNNMEVSMEEVYTWTITLRNGKVLRATNHPFHFWVKEKTQSKKKES